MKITLKIIALCIVIILMIFFVIHLHYQNEIKRLRTAVQTDDAPTVSSLLAAHPEFLTIDLDQDRHSKLKPLSVAAGTGHEMICSNLLAAGADVNEQDRYGQTPLELAVTAEETNVVVLLLAHGAKVSIKNQWGKTVLDTARDYKVPDSIINMLSKAAN